MLSKVGARCDQRANTSANRAARAGYRLLDHHDHYRQHPRRPSRVQADRDGGVPADPAASRPRRSPAAGGPRVALASRAQGEPRPVAFERAGLRGLLAFIAVGLILWALIIYGLLWAFR